MARSPWSLTLCWLSACGAGWHRTELSPETELPPKQQVQVWEQGHSRVLHGVVVEEVTVTGIPFQLPLNCDSCRVTLLRSAVDSMRLGNQEKGALRGFGIGFLSLLAATVVLAGTVDRD